MNNLKFVGMALFLASVLIFGIGCGDDEECESSDSACGTFTVCCTDSDCYYKASDGTKFNCDGVNCGDAASRLADYMCGKSSSVQEYQSAADQALEAARERVIILR